MDDKQTGLHEISRILGQLEAKTEHVATRIDQNHTEVIRRMDAVDAVRSEHDARLVKLETAAQDYYKTKKAVFRAAASAGIGGLALGAGGAVGGPTLVKALTGILVALGGA